MTPRELVRALAEGLAAAGVARIFGMPGGRPNLDMIGAASEQRTRHVIRAPLGQQGPDLVIADSRRPGRFHARGRKLGAHAPRAESLIYDQASRSVTFLDHDSAHPGAAR